MKLGRFHIEYWPELRLLAFHRIHLYCGCWRLALGPFTLEYVRKSSKCYPHSTCTNWRPVKYSCGHTFWSGWGIPDPESYEVCPRCEVGDHD